MPAATGCPLLVLLVLVLVLALALALRVAAAPQRRHACFFAQDKKVTALAVGSDPEMRQHALHILQTVRAFLLPRFW